MLAQLTPSILLYLLFFLLPGNPSSATENQGNCTKSPQAATKWASQNKNRLYICNAHSQQVSFCKSPVKGTQCQTVDQATQWITESLLLKTKKWQTSEITQLATYSAIFPQNQFRRGNELKIQTGRYGFLAINPKKKPKCWKEIFASAFILQQTFPQVTFVVSDQIHNCRALQAGTQELVRHQSRVATNISRFSTPLHSIYLTNESKFNHHQFGQMGLYINVNRQGEIARRLVDFRISLKHIPHETHKGRVGGLR